MTRAFGPSNAPDTCLYRGATLRHTVRKERRWTTTVSLCCQAPILSTPNWRGRTPLGYECTRCQRTLVLDGDDTEEVEHVEPERRSEHAGYAGFFCTYGRGYRFGVLAARKGVRYRAAPT